MESENKMNFEEQVLTALSELNNKLSKVEEGLTETVEKVDVRLTETVEKVDVGLTETVEKVDVRLAETVEKVDVRLAETLEKVDERLAENLEKVEKKLKENLAEVAEKLQENTWKTDLVNQGLARLESDYFKKMGAIIDGWQGYTEKVPVINKLEEKVESHGTRIWALEQAVNA